MIYKGITITPDDLKQMREWAKDCQWAEDYTPEEIDELPDMTILRGIDANYDGGVYDFIIGIHGEPRYA